MSKQFTNNITGGSSQINQGQEGGEATNITNNGSSPDAMHALAALLELMAKEAPEPTEESGEVPDYHPVAMTAQIDAIQDQDTTEEDQATMAERFGSCLKEYGTSPAAVGACELLVTAVKASAKTVFPLNIIGPVAEKFIEIVRRDA